jgi:Na+-transporting methylmalonyl-CoA/oxaloacetate decarboxylase gamma subunit/flavin-binding protein dodecin
LSRAKIEEAIEDAADGLGNLKFFDRGEFEITGGKFQSFATVVNISGKLAKGRTEGEWTLCMGYVIKPSGGCWAIAIVGFFIVFIFSFLILLIPLMAKSEVQRAVERTVRDARDEVEDERDEDSRSKRRRLS